MARVLAGDGVGALERLERAEGDVAEIADRRGYETESAHAREYGTVGREVKDAGRSD